MFPECEVPLMQGALMQEALLHSFERHNLVHLIKVELIHIIASVWKSVTEAWYVSISNARCLLDVKKRRFKNCPLGVVHFEYFTEPTRLESFSWCIHVSVSETRISAITEV